MLLTLTGMLLTAPPASAAPKHVSSCNFPAMTDVVVTKDLSCPGTSAIIVGKNGITIDLGGHTLLGDRTSATFGVDDTAGHRDITVRHGTITKFDTGVHAPSANNLAMNGLVLSGNVSWGAYDTGNGGSAHSVNASGNGESGLQFNGGHATVVSSQASDNHEWGVYIAGDNATVAGVSASSNGQTGIQVNGDHPHVAHANTSGNAQWGVYLAGASPVVHGAQADDNGESGVQANGDDARISGVSASGNAQWGLFVAGQSPHVSSSKANGNALVGVQVNGDATVLSSIHASANGTDGVFVGGAHVVVSSVRADGNIDDGLYVSGDHARVRASRSWGNHGNGITVSGDAPRIGRLPGGSASDRNVADGNGFVAGLSDSVGYGIQATGFTILPRGRNEASGNDNPAECDPANLC